MLVDGNSVAILEGMVDNVNVNISLGKNNDTKPIHVCITDLKTCIIIMFRSRIGMGGGGRIGLFSIPGLS